MNLDIDRVLGMSGEDRMFQIWDFIKEKNRGELPCRMMFLEGPKIQKRGFRWTPSTLLPSTERFHNVQTRSTQWHETLRGNITLDGLFAEYPGYRLFPLKHSKSMNVESSSIAPKESLRNLE